MIALLLRNSGTCEKGVGGEELERRRISAANYD